MHANVGIKFPISACETLFAARLTLRLCDPPVTAMGVLAVWPGRG